MSCLARVKYSEEGENQAVADAIYSATEKIMELSALLPCNPSYKSGFLLCRMHSYLTITMISFKLGCLMLDLSGPVLLQNQSPLKNLNSHPDPTDNCG